MSETQQHLRGIARGGALGLVGAVISASTTFLLVLIVTNSMDKSDAGQFFSATSFFVIAVALSALGTDAGLGRFTSKYLVDGNRAAARTCWSSAFMVTFGLAIAVAAAAIVFREPLARTLGLESPSSEGLLTLLAIGVPAATLMGVSLSATRALASMRATVLIDKIARIVGQCVLVLVAVGLGGSLAALGVAWTLPYVAAAVAAAWVARAAARRRLAPVPGNHDVAGVRRAFWRFTWPRSVAQFSQMTIQRADIIIIAALISPAAAAVYTAATRFIAFGQFGSQAIQQTIQPRFSHLLASGQLSVLSGVYRTSTAWAMLVAWPVFVAVGAAPGIYLSMFGEGYRSEGQAVVITMALAMMIGVASGPVDTMLLMDGRSSLSLTNSLIALTTDLTLCFVLIPPMGILGAAVAWNAAVVIRSTLGYVQVRRINGLTPFSRATLVAGLTPVLTFGIPIGALSLSGHLGLVTYFSAIAILTCVYVGVLWTQREILHLTAFRALLTRGRPASRVVS